MICIGLMGCSEDDSISTNETVDNGILLVGETTSTNFPNLQNKGKSDAVVIKIK